MAADGVTDGRSFRIKEVGSGLAPESSGLKAGVGKASPSATGSDKAKGSMKTANPWSRPPMGRYEWDAPSPSRAEVDELIRLFPDIVQVSVSSLESEASAWGEKAVLARSLSRWVPPEAIVRELHRSGMSGEVEVIPLAHRHYLIRLSDPHSKVRMLERPWVINGQVLAVADWKPEFFPAEDSLLHALLWIRLPLLPMEFWADDILSSILSVAGEFLYSDESTKARKRGGFARACVRVDLGHPLRPGARVRGIGAPFWQQFSFENLEGICDRCASLHLSGPCKQAGETNSSSSAPSFGPWLAAVRRRRPSPAQNPVLSGGVQSSPISSPVSLDGWSVPKKVARRQPRPAAGSLVLPSGTGAGRGEAAGPRLVAKGSREHGLLLSVGSSPLVSVPISVARDDQVDTRKSSSVPVGTVAQFQGLSEGAIQPDIPNSIKFPKLGLVDCTSKDPVSGPSKRARPVEPLSTRMPSRSSRTKGKASIIGRREDQAPFSFAASSMAGQGSLAHLGPGAKKARGRVGASSGTATESTLPPHLDSCTHTSAVHQLQQAIQLSESAVQMDSIQIVDCADTGSRECLEVAPGDTEILMDSDQIANCKGLGDLDCSAEMSGVMVGALPNPVSP